MSQIQNRDSKNANEGCLRILHVDDDPSILDISKFILMDMGNFDIDQAGSVDEAFKKLSTRHYDVIISDYEMPQKNGLQFLKELHEQNKDTPFILFTGKGREEVAIQALNLGANGYINKTGGPETVYGELSHTINQIAEHSKAKNELRQQAILLVTLTSQTPGMLYQFKRRPDGTYCVPHTSEAIHDIFGCSPQDVLEDFSPITKVIVPEDLDKVVRSIDDSATHVTPWQCEYRVQLPGQQIRWIWGQSVPEKIEDGSIIWNGYNADITERKQAEETARRTEQERIEQLTMLADFSRKLNLSETLDETCMIICGAIKETLGPGYVTVTLMDKSEQSLTIKATAGFDNKGLVNSAARIIGGDPRGTTYYIKDMLPEELAQFRSGKLELFAGGLYEATTRRYPKLACTMLERLMGVQFVYTFGFIHKNRHLGGAMILLNSQEAIQKNTPLLEALIGQSSPVISRFFTELKLRDSEEKHRVISNLMADVAFSCVKPEGGNYTIDWITGATEKMFGYSIEEIKKRGCWKFVVDPKDLHIFEEKIDKLNPNQSSTCELRIVHPDGSTSLIRVSSRAEKDKTNSKSSRLFGACENITKCTQSGILDQPLI